MARSRSNNAAVIIGESDLGEAQIKKHRPKDTKLRQQRLPAWQPILNAKTVIPVFFSISILFIPIGIVLLITSNGVKEWSIYYDTLCERITDSINHTCIIQFELKDDFMGDVYFYYGLEKYYQNHRRYMRSRNDLQMLGRLDQTAECAPFDMNSEGKKIAPCGAIANSMFNDTFKLVEMSIEGEKDISWSYQELVWPIDREKFHNPKCEYEDCKNINDLCNAFKNYEKPPNWVKNPCNLDETNVDNSGFQNADFIIWMRTAALPDFRKPYRKLNNKLHPNGLRKGDYKLMIQNTYNISSFSGRKSFIISTTSWLGGKNPFLGFAYIGVGILCALIGAVFIVIHVKYGHTLQEMAGVDQARTNHQNGGRQRHPHNQ